MLRVGLTGGLGSGKSTVADIFVKLGAHVIKADAVGRDLMRSGTPVYQKIVERFGAGILLNNGELNRGALAQIVFEGEHSATELDALNAIVHPAVIDAQMNWLAELAEREPQAVAIVESALIFETKYDAAKRSFQRLVLVTAPDEIKITRFVTRNIVARANAGSSMTAPELAALEADARHRLAHQIPDAVKAPRCDYLIDNSGPLEVLEQQVRKIYAQLAEEARLR